DRCRRRRSAIGQHLPVRHLCADPKSRPPGSRASARREVKRGEIKVSAPKDHVAREVDRGRRVFLQRTALASGGLVLALALPPGSGGPRAGGEARGGQFRGGQLNAWLRIGTDDSITIVVDRSEMGQGVYTALPTLLAEELEVDLARIRIVSAPVGEA